MVSMIITMHSVRYPIRLEDSRTQGQSSFTFPAGGQVLYEPIMYILFFSLSVTFLFFTLLSFLPLPIPLASQRNQKYIARPNKPSR